jgi:hypothetical protein
VGGTWGLGATAGSASAFAAGFAPGATSPPGLCSGWHKRAPRRRSRGTGAGFVPSGARDRLRSKADCRSCHPVQRIARARPWPRPLSRVSATPCKQAAGFASHARIARGAGSGPGPQCRRRIGEPPPHRRDRRAGSRAPGSVPALASLTGWSPRADNSGRGTGACRLLRGRLAQSVRARGSHPRGHWFESSIAHQSHRDCRPASAGKRTSPWHDCQEALSGKPAIYLRRSGAGSWASHRLSARSLRPRTKELWRRFGDARRGPHAVS